MIGRTHARLDGRPVPPGEAAAVDPRRRDPVPRGLYETVLVRRGRPRLARAHAERLAGSSAALDLGRVVPDRLVADLAAVARRAGDRRSRLRVLRWEERGDVRELIALDPEPPPPAEIVLAVSPESRPADLDARRHKRIDAPDLDRARDLAATRGVFDVLLLTDDGRVLEGAKTNVFWRTGGTIRTPSTRLPILPGTVRARFLASARRGGFEVLETESSLSEVLSSEEVIVTNAMLGVRRRVRLRP